MIGLDTSILVAHAIGEHPCHPPVRQWLDRTLSEGRTFALTSGILAEFIHITTDSRRFEKPLSMSEALQWAGFWSDAREVTLVPAGDAAHAQGLQWLAKFDLGRKRLLDTLIAATWHTAGIEEIGTLNPKDFAIFAAFRIHHLHP